MTLVIMAAGSGTRFGGLKQLEIIDSYGHILMDYSIFDAVEAGFDRVVIVIKKQIEEKIRSVMEKRYEKWGIRVDFAYQELDSFIGKCYLYQNRTKPWGTAHAVACLDQMISTPFVLINADDYYGKGAFHLMADFLRENRGDWAMLYYPLKNTLSKNGAVSRGVCRIKSGRLMEISEIYGIRAHSKHILAEGGKELDGNLPVSMNFWCFSDEIINECKKGFADFLSNLQGEEILSREYGLSQVISELLCEGRAEIRAIECDEIWQGITNKEDKADVQDYFDRLIYDCIYPVDL